MAFPLLSEHLPGGGHLLNKIKVEEEEEGSPWSYVAMGDTT